MSDTRTVPPGAVRAMLLMGFWAAAAAGAAPESQAGRDPRLHFESVSPGPRVIELYTSEGCSSCPPADRWLAALASQPQLWARYVPLAFHVDYWDALGWPDRFASRRHTARQRAYARNGRLSQVYTPAFVVGGNE